MGIEPVPALTRVAVDEKGRIILRVQYRAPTMTTPTTSPPYHLTAQEAAQLLGALSDALHKTVPQIGPRPPGTAH
jgi:hypothetical protein